jgi:hypothetical protein
MAEKDDVILKIKEKIAKLDQDSAKAYREQLKALKDNNSALETYKNLLEDVDTRIEDQSRGFAGLLSEIKKINEELGKENKHIKDATRAFKGLESIASKLRDDQKGYTDLNKEQLKQEKSKLKILAEQARAAAKQIAIDKGIVDLAHVNLAFRHDLSEEERALLTAAQENFSIYERTNKLLEDRIKEENKLNKTLGSTGLLLAGMSKIPIVGPLLKTNEALDAARAKAKAGGGAFASMGAAIGSMSKSLVSGLTDPLAIVGLLVKGFQMFLDIGFKADKQITDLSKSMAISHEEATATRDRFIEIQNSGESIFETTENLVAAQIELAGAMGATRGFTEQQVRDQVLLTKQMGLTAEEAGGIQQLAMANGMAAKDVTNSVIKQTAALAKQTGIQLDNKAIVGEVAKVSGQLRLQYANNPKLIAKAVVETKKLGINMEIAANAAKGLLDFESSIENELSAELLTGKALNLERARGLALNGDSVGAAKEMLAQVGSAAEFANMNVIQQEAIAKAVGMSTDDLANSLVTQENLKKLGDETRSQVEEQIEAAKKLKDTDKVRMLEASIGNEEEAQIALEKVNAQDKLNAAVDKMKSMLSSILEGPAAGLIDWIGKLAGDAKLLKSVFETVKNTMKGMAQLALAKLAINVYASLANVPVIGPGLGLAAGIAAYAWGQSLIPSFEEGGIVQGSSYKGDNVKANVNSGEMVLNGSQQKNLFDTANGKGGKGNNNQDSSALISAINGLRSDIKALASRPINTSVQIDGKELATMQGKYPNEAGDANGKVAYQMS